MAFLRDLKRTLDPLANVPGLDQYPDYSQQLSEQVGCIKEPVESFLQSVLRYERSLGATAAQGHYRRMLPKLKWYLFVSKKVLALKQKIQSRMRVIDTLIQRLTL